MLDTTRWRAFLPLLAAALGGIAAEVLKLLLRRERPETNAGAYVFRSRGDDPISTSGLSLPSSHALVACAAAAMLARLYPRARWLWFGLAAGCALTRVLSHKHYLSDVTLSAIMGWAVAAILTRWYVRLEPDRGTTRTTGNARRGSRVPTKGVNCTELGSPLVGAGLPLRVEGRSNE